MCAHQNQVFSFCFSYWITSYRKLRHTTGLRVSLISFFSPAHKTQFRAKFTESFGISIFVWKTHHFIGCYKKCSYIFVYCAFVRVSRCRRKITCEHFVVSVVLFIVISRTQLILGIFLYEEKKWPNVAHRNAKCDHILRTRHFGAGNSCRTF